MCIMEELGVKPAKPVLNPYAPTTRPTPYATRATLLALGCSASLRPSSEINILLCDR